MDKRKKFIEECLIKRMSYKDIGLLLGISRQRAHQIHTGYYSPTNRPKEISELKTWTKRKREFLGLPLEIDIKEGGLDYIREIVRIRDNHTCQKCLKKWIKGNRRFDVHHLDEKMESVRDLNYDRNNMDKMITFCHKCHLNLHSVKEKMRNGAKKFSTINKY